MMKKCLLFALIALLVFPVSSSASSIVIKRGTMVL